MNLREHFFALSVHGGILVAICILVLTTSCGKEEPVEEPDGVTLFFREVQTALDTAEAESIMIIAVDDSIEAGEDLQRQIMNEIQAELNNLDSVAIFETNMETMAGKLAEMDITPAKSIVKEDIIELATDREVDTLLYASIESEAPDVCIRIYSGKTGRVIFVDTLQAWELPVAKKSEPVVEEIEESGEVGENEEDLMGKIQG